MLSPELLVRLLEFRRERDWEQLSARSAVLSMEKLRCNS